MSKMMVGDLVSFAFLDDEPNGFGSDGPVGVEQGIGFIKSIGSEPDPFIVVDTMKALYCLLSEEITGIY